MGEVVLRFFSMLYQVVVSQVELLVSYPALLAERTEKFLHFRSRRVGGSRPQRPPIIWVHFVLIEVMAALGVAEPIAELVELSKERTTSIIISNALLRIAGGVLGFVLGYGLWKGWRLARYIMTLAFSSQLIHTLADEYKGGSTFRAPWYTLEDVLTVLFLGLLSVGLWVGPNVRQFFARKPGSF